MSRAQPPFLDLPPHALTSALASVLLTSHRDHQCEDDQRQGAEFGRLTEQSTFTGYEPNNLIEVGNTEIMPLFFQRRTSRASTYHSGEDTVATFIDSEVDDAQIAGMLASTLYIQERERQVQTDPDFFTLIEKIRRRAHPSFSQVRGNLHRSSHTKESQAHSFIPRQEEFLENVNKVKSSWNYKHIMLLKDNKKVYPDSLKPNFVREFFFKNHPSKQP